VLLRPIDEFSSSSAENEALDLIRSGDYDEAADGFRAISKAEQFEIRHRFNLAYCLSLTGDIEEALATTRASLRAQFQDPSYMPSLKKWKEQFEFGATCYLTAYLDWREGNYAMAADWLDLLERFVGMNLMFSQDLRLLARLASRSAVLSSDLESLHPIPDRPSLHLTICTASSLRSTGRFDLLQRLLESQASLPVHVLLALWKQAVSPAESKDDLVRRLLTDGARGVTIVEASSHEAAEAASSQPEPAVQVYEHAEDTNDPNLLRSGSVVESSLLWRDEPREVDVAQPVRIALDYLLTINWRRADRLGILQSLLKRLDSEAIKQWHTMLDELGQTGRELDEAFDAFKSASLADLHQYERRPSA
jgi:tetratricopeptide (TPR) repeat protein